MIAAGSLDYAHARISARYGERPDQLAWSSIEVIRELPALLDAARALPFRHWVAGIAPDAGPHRIEAVLTSQRRVLVGEVVGWMPEAWQPAVAWAGVLADLPVALHLARGGDAMPWMQDDPVYRTLCDDRTRAPTRGVLLPLAPAWSHPDGLLRAWRHEWARRVPGGTFFDSVIVDRCARALSLYRAAMADASTGDGTALRRSLAARLSLLFRQATLTPAAALIFLALSVLDLERLRGELLRRAIFPGFGLAP